MNTDRCAASLQQTLVCRGHTGNVYSLVEIQYLDAMHVASGSYDGTIRIWNPCPSGKRA